MSLLAHIIIVVAVVEEVTFPSDVRDLSVPRRMNWQSLG